VDPEHRPSGSIDAVPGGSRVLVVSGSVGGGHDGVAHELAARLRARGHTVEVVDLLDGFPAWARFLLGAGYLLTLRTAPFLYEGLCVLVERSRRFQRVASWVCGTAAPWLARRSAGADLVVATYPPAAQAMGRLRAAGKLPVPTVTYLTDPAPNYLWVHPEVDLHLCASPATAEETTERYGIDVQAAGPLVGTAFRTADRRAARARLAAELGVDPSARLALVTFGSLGVGESSEVVAALQAADLLPVVVCGRNERLARRLDTTPGAVPLRWRTDMPDVVAAADLVVHNAGGLSLTESQVAGVPAVTFAPLPGHGRANAHSLERSGAAPWARSAAELTALAREAVSRPRVSWPEHEETAATRISLLADASAGGHRGATTLPAVPVASGQPEA
jgi:processive 1,2-diacylglycerol beta-glucosyltransferase